VPPPIAGADPHRRRVWAAAGRLLAGYRPQLPYPPAEFGHMPGCGLEAGAEAAEEGGLRGEEGLVVPVPVDAAEGEVPLLLPDLVGKLADDGPQVAFEASAVVDGRQHGVDCCCFGEEAVEGLAGGCSVRRLSHVDAPIVGCPGVVWAAAPGRFAVLDLHDTPEG
jgi:hypothetical protein